MAPYYPPPDPQTLLPPILACLPSAFASRRPPPALFPLLSPILRQRVRLLSETSSGSSDSSDSSWLSFLCWESYDASELTSIVEKADFEPHPVSGEVELGEISRPQYRRLDEETLQSMLKVQDMGLSVVFLWCTEDQEGGKDGWRVSEVLPLNTTFDRTSRPWSSSVDEAEDELRESYLFSRSESQNGVSHASLNGSKSQAATDDTDDDYWARYDQTPSQTPGDEPSSFQSSRPKDESADEDYFSRYARVQPAMDNDDPSAKKENRTLLEPNGGLRCLEDPSGAHRDEFESHQNEAENRIIHTRPSSSSSSAVVSHLEKSAGSQSHAEFAVQQHISTSMKSLFRLARGAGIDKVEFERLVKTELEAMCMMEDD